MAIDHPFQSLFETLGRLPDSHAESVNRLATETLLDTLSVPVEHDGRCVLLRAPRAGHGKTHLLSRVQHQLTANHEFIPLHAASGNRIDAASVTDDVIKRLLRPLPASGGLTMLDLIARRLFATALQPLVGSGEVPCQDREGALAALRIRPIETFDFHHPHAVTAHWARENFELLEHRLSLELSQRAGLSPRDATFWVNVLFRFSSTPLDQPERSRVLSDSIREGLRNEGVAMDRLTALLGLLSSLTRVVLVADDLEGFSADESGALKFGALIGSLRQSAERVDVVISLNQDVWENAFLPRLSGGLVDRLSEVVIELKPLAESEMVDLLDSRAPGLGVKILSHIRQEPLQTHARGLIRAAAAAWIEADRVRKAQFTESIEAGAATAGPPSPEPPAEVEPEPVSSVEAPEPITLSIAPIAEEAKNEIQATMDSPETESVSQENPDADRVDDLLRKFRERYGKSSL